MPLTKIEHNDGHPWGLWTIEEDEKTLRDGLPFTEDVPVWLRKDTKRLEWLAGRKLVKTLLGSLGIPFEGIFKDPFGKPYPVGNGWQLSLSHSYPYVAGYLHAHHSVGIDLEQPKEKLLRIAPRILNETELADAGKDITKLCLIWCAKEVMIKVHGKKDLIFAENLQISPFLVEKKGNFIGRIIERHKETIVPLYYEIHPEFTLVLNKPEP